MVPWLRRYYAYAVFAAFGLLLLVGDPALLIMGMALAIGALPLAFGPEADEIAREINRRAHDDAADGDTSGESTHE